MVRNVPICFLTFSLFLFAAGCALSGGDHDEQSKPAVVTVGAAEAGDTVTLAAGDRLVVSLPANPGTGYTWELQPAPDENILKIAGEPKFLAQEPNRVGATGLLSFTFDTLQAGETELTLVYHRAWETGVPPLETYDLTVVVK